MKFFQMKHIHFASVLAYLAIAAIAGACTMRIPQPEPEALPTSTAAATDPLATFWLSTPTGAAQPPALTPAVPATPAAGETAVPGAPLATQGGSALPGTAPSASSNYPPVVAVARTWLAGQLNLIETSVVIQNVERVEWPDTCLGLGEPGQGCALVVTPGYRIIFYANGQNFEVRVDDTGRVLRMLEGGKG